MLRARALCKTYGSGDTAVHALREVDLDVRAGEFVLLLGALGQRQVGHRHRERPDAGGRGAGAGGDGRKVRVRKP